MQQPFSSLASHRNQTILPNFLTQFDRRSVLFIWASYIVIVMSVDKFDFLKVCIFASFPLFVAIVCRISFSRIAWQLLLVLPFITLLAIANPFLDRSVYFQIGAVPVTGGMISAMVIIIKSILSLSVMLILERTISMNGIGNALKRLGVPAVFITQLLLLHRYLFLIANEAAMMTKARDLRSCSAWGKGVMVTANLIGALLIRSTERSERIYRSMLMRGFSGIFPVDETNDFRLRDILFSAASLSAFLFFRVNG